MGNENMSGKIAPPVRNGEVIMRVHDGLRQIRDVFRMCRFCVHVRESECDVDYREGKRILAEIVNELYVDWSTYDHVNEDELNYPAMYASFFVLGDKLRDYQSLMGDKLDEYPDEKKTIRTARYERADVRTGWTADFNRLLTELITSINTPSMALWDSEMEQEDVDAFWTSVNAMELSFVQLLRLVYDYQTARRVSNYKKMIQDDQEWRDLCECCVWMLHCRERALVDFYNECMTARETLHKELEGVALNFALYKGDKQSMVDAAESVREGAKKKKRGHRPKMGGVEAWLRQVKALTE